MDIIGKAGFPLGHNYPAPGISHEGVKRHVPDESCPQDAKKMKGHRHRAKSGQLVKKRGDTHLRTLEETYGDISCRPNETKLSELRKVTGEVGINKVRNRLKQMEKVVGQPVEQSQEPENTAKTAEVPRFLTDF